MFAIAAIKMDDRAALNFTKLSCFEPGNQAFGQLRRICLLSGSIDLPGTYEEKKKCREKKRDFSSLNEDE